MTPLDSTPPCHFTGFEVIDLEAFVRETPQQQEVPAPQPKSQALVPKILVAADHVLDLVPIGSTASNLVNIGLKHTLFKGVDPESSEYKEYIKHLQEKQTTTCLVYSIPVVGNVLKLGVSSVKLVTNFVGGSSSTPKIDLVASREALKHHPILKEKTTASGEQEANHELGKVTI